MLFVTKQAAGWFMMFLYDFSIKKKKSTKVAALNQNTKCRFVLRERQMSFYIHNGKTTQQLTSFLSRPKN